MRACLKLWILLCLTVPLSACQGNPFRAKISSQPPLGLSPDDVLACGKTRNQPLKGKVFILIHGIYGDSATFGSLPEYLREDHPGSCVYVMSYWSSQFLPNFQKLDELGSEFRLHLERIGLAASGSEIIIIAHSQGGLLAKDAILKLKKTLP